MKNKVTRVLLQYIIASVIGSFLLSYIWSLDLEKVPGFEIQKSDVAAGGCILMILSSVVAIPFVLVRKLDFWIFDFLVAFLVALMIYWLTFSFQDFVTVLLCYGIPLAIVALFFRLFIDAEEV